MEESLITRSVSNLASAGVGALISAGALAINPAWGIPAVLFSAVISDEAKHFASKILSAKEDDRVSRTLKSTKDKIEAKLSSGEVHRWVDIYSNHDPIPLEPKELLEGVLLKVRDEYVQKKEDLYSSFYANYCFDKSVTDYEANLILLLLHKLSFHQILILSYLQKNNIIDSNKWDIGFAQKDELSKYFSMYADCESLYSDRLVFQDKSQKGIKLGFPNKLSLSPIGEKLVTLTELTNLNTQEIETELKTISTIIERLYRNELS